jgi:DNA-directed RNA polymerase II subunit RPB1
MSCTAYQETHLSEITSAPRRPRLSLLSRGLALLVASLLGSASLLGLAQAAQAAAPGITSTMLYKGSALQPGTVLTAGDALDLKVQYDNSKVTPGSTVTFDVGSNVAVSSLPAANTSIASVTQNGSVVTVTFRDPLPTDVVQGVFDIGLSVKNPAQSGPDDITWKIDGDGPSIPVTIKRTGDTPPPTTPADAKSVTPTDLNKYVKVATDGTVTMDPTIANQTITYTLTLTSTQAQTDFPITDQLPSYLGYDAASFTSTLTTWDANGLNKTTTAPAPYPVTVNGNSFTSTTSVPGPSILSITYTVHVIDPDGLAAALQAQLQGKAAGTSFTLPLQNTASFNGQQDKATVNVRGTVPSPPCTGLCTHTLSKASSWDSRNVLTGADGNLTPAQEIVYTLKANVGTTDAALPVNVVLSDPLPAGAAWNSTDPQFITGTALTKAADCPDVTTFAGDSYVGQWCVNGQTLLVNLGNNKSTNATINAKALVTSVSTLPRGGTTTIAGATPYQLPNTATLAYGGTNPVTASKTVTVVQLPTNGGAGYTDASVFSKTANGAPAAVNPGDSAQVPYVFKVGAGKGIDLTKSTITDFVDHSVFGTVDPSALNPTGKYNNVSLDKSAFTVSDDAEGNLVIGLSAAGKAIVTTQGIDKAFELDLTLTTLPFTGKVTKTIANSASLTGAAGQPPYVSTVSSTTTSYGSEAEVDKTLYDPATGTYTGTLQATTNGAATYVYRIDFVPHGGYDQVAISKVVDNLPAGLAFLGFVQAGDTAAANPSQGPIDIGGNLEAVYDSGAGTVTIQQKSGTVLNDPNGDTLSAYFAARVASLTAPIVNRVGGSTATIVPVKKVSVGDYVWADSNRDGRQDGDEPGIPGVVLTITGPDGNPVTDVSGNPIGPVTTDADGKYTFDNLPALTGDQTYTVQIDRTASATVLAPYVPTTAGTGDQAGDSSTWTASTQPGDLHDDGDRDPTLDFGFVSKSYAIGDYVWIDSNANGVQDGGEKPLPGVGVTLLDSHGAVVATTTTDSRGRYSFDNLSAGTYQVRFTLTDDQKKLYRFTDPDSGSNDGADSDAASVDGLTRQIVLDDTNTALTTSYNDAEIHATQGIDPTWDAGVVLKPVPPVISDPKTPTGGLATTGSDIWPGIGAAALAVLVGVAALVVATVRRRRRSIAGH